MARSIGNLDIGLMVGYFGGIGAFFRGFRRDLNDRNLIRKGVNEPTYLISGLARSDVNIMMKLRAQLMIFGGWMLSVFCLVLLLLRFGLL